MARKSIPRQAILDMRKQYEHGYRIVDLARAYVLAENTVSNIVHYRTHQRVRPGSNESRNVPHLPLTQEQKERGLKRTKRRLGIDRS